MNSVCLQSDSVTYVNNKSGFISEIYSYILMGISRKSRIHIPIFDGKN